MREWCYPFAAIAGQEKAKQALLLNLVNPRIGGVLLSGEKGTAKSTIARGAAALSDKDVVDLPLNATEEMLTGTLDLEAAVKEGIRKRSKGVLTRADGNLLYVDEINLLPDSMAAILLSSASAGENLVEREGISERQACSFILVGTMNPEEGNLRPQLLDKFGLYVEMSGESDVELRVEIIRRRLEYEKDPRSFCEKYKAETEKLQKKVKGARAVLGQVRADENVRRVAGQLAASAFCQGNRAEILLVETACAIAALEGRRLVSVTDLKEAAVLVLPHRRGERAERAGAVFGGEQQEEQLGEQQAEQGEEGQAGQQERQRAAQDTEDASGKNEAEGTGLETYAPPDTSGLTGESQDRESPAEGGEEIYPVRCFSGYRKDRLARKGTGRRQKTDSSVNKGRYAGVSMNLGKRSGDIALDATLRAAAPFQRERHSDCRRAEYGREERAIIIENRDLRYKRRESHVGATIVFVVDASGSMGAAKRMKEAKEAVLSMLMDSYQKRDKIGLIAFCREGAEILLGITSSADLARKALQSLPTGGRTPLADGLYSAWQLLRARRRKDPEMFPLVVLVTDGHANRALWSDDPVEDAMKAARLIANEKIPAIVVDTENNFLSFHIAGKIAEAMDADYYKVEELRSTQLKRIVTSDGAQRNG